MNIESGGYAEQTNCFEDFIYPEESDDPTEDFIYPEEPEETEARLRKEEIEDAYRDGIKRGMEVARQVLCDIISVKNQELRTIVWAQLLGCAPLEYRKDEPVAKKLGITKQAVSKERGNIKKDWPELGIDSGATRTHQLTNSTNFMPGDN